MKIKRGWMTRLLVGTTFLLGVACGVVLHVLVGGHTSSEGANAAEKPRGEQVQYYRRMELANGWKPVGYEPVSKDEVADRVFYGYRFVYRDGELYTVSEGTFANAQVVWGKAFVLHPDVSPYGRGPFIIGLGSDNPRYGRNFTAYRGLRYWAAFDNKGALARYTVDRDALDGYYETNFRCTYGDHGLLTRLEVVGENELKDDFPFVSKQWFYNDEARRVVEVVQRWHETVGTYYHWDDQNHFRGKRIMARWAADGSYEVLYLVGAEEQGEGWVERKELPEEFRKYIAEFPMPAGKGQ